MCTVINAPLECYFNLMSGLLSALLVKNSRWCYNQLANLYI